MLFDPPGPQFVSAAFGMSSTQPVPPCTTARIKGLRKPNQCTCFLRFLRCHGPWPLKTKWIFPTLAWILHEFVWSKLLNMFEVWVNFKASGPNMFKANTETANELDVATSTQKTSAPKSRKRFDNATDSGQRKAGPSSVQKQLGFHGQQSGQPQEKVSNNVVFKHLQTSKTMDPWWPMAITMDKKIWSSEKDWPVASSLQIFIQCSNCGKNLPRSLGP